MILFRKKVADIYGISPGEVSNLPLTEVADLMAYLEFERLMQNGI
jgi:hypothetical protein